MTVIQKVSKQAATSFKKHLKNSALRLTIPKLFTWCVDMKIGSEK